MKKYCPHCGKLNKAPNKIEQCMYCGQPLHISAASLPKQTSQASSPPTPQEPDYSQAISFSIDNLVDQCVAESERVDSSPQVFKLGEGENGKAKLSPTQREKRVAKF